MSSSRDTIEPAAPNHVGCAIDVVSISAPSKVAYECNIGVPAGISVWSIYVCWRPSGFRKRERTTSPHGSPLAFSMIMPSNVKPVLQYSKRSPGANDTGWVSAISTNACGLVGFVASTASCFITSV